MKKIIYLILFLTLIYSAEACLDVNTITDHNGLAHFFKGQYEICSGTYEASLVIWEKGVSINCQPKTTFIGHGEWGLSTWNIGVQFPLGSIVQADFFMQDCIFKNSTVGVAGMEVDEDFSYTFHPSNGYLILINNTFKTPYSIYWCNGKNQFAFLANNKGKNGLLTGFKNYFLFQNSKNFIEKHLFSAGFCKS